MGFNPESNFLDQEIIYADDVFVLDDVKAPDSVCHLAKCIMFFINGSCLFSELHPTSHPMLSPHPFGQKVHLEKF
jgi:hypothetical protein